MTGEQFAALAELAGMRSGDAVHAAELVLVHRRRPADAARESGLSPQGVANAVSRLRRALDLAKLAVGAPLR